MPEKLDDARSITRRRTAEVKTKAMLRFKGEYDTWSACDDGGKLVYQLKPGAQIPVELDEEGVITDALLREALEAGIAEVIENA